MKLVRQKDPDGCGVAVFAMLTGRTYGAAKKHLGFVSGERDGKGVSFPRLRRALEEDGHFCRSVTLAAEAAGGIWPPRPFAPAHFAAVGQPSGNGHYVAMNHLGGVLDPMRPGERHSLDEWDVVSEVCGVL